MSSTFRAMIFFTFLASFCAPVSAEEQLFLNMLKGPGALDSLAQEIGMKIKGAVACRIQHLLPEGDIATIVGSMRKVDAQVVVVAFQKAELIVNGLRLAPGSVACQVIAEQIEKAKPTYAQLAGVIRN